MAHYPARTPPPPPPLSRYGAATPSLEGLERTARSIPARSVRSSRPPLTSRQTSSASVNKPLPPEPPLPLFSTTPSPRSTPQPSHQGGSNDEPGPRSSPIKNPKARPGRRTEPALPRGHGHQIASSSHSDDPHGLTPLSTSTAQRPVSATPTTIIESYASGYDAEPMPRSRTPLIAPQARLSRTPGEQQAHLQRFESFDPNVLSPTSERMYSVAHDDSEELRFGRKESLAYRFDTPAEDDPQISFQQPVWAEDGPANEDVALKSRSTLTPSPFSPTSDYGDDSHDVVAPTPTIPILPPLPVNSPFRLPQPSGLDNRSGSGDGWGPTLQSSPKPPPANHSRAPSREQASRSAAVAFSNVGESQHQYPQREFGSQVSWEPGDDAARMRKASAVSGSMSRVARMTPPAMSNSSSSSLSVGPYRAPRNKPGLSNPVSHFLAGATPPPVLGASIDRPMSGPAFRSSAHEKSSTPTSFETDVYDDPNCPPSQFSDDSDEEYKGKKWSIGVRGRSRGKLKGLDPVAMNASPSAMLIALPGRSESNDRRGQATDDRSTLVGKIQDWTEDIDQFSVSYAKGADRDPASASHAIGGADGQQKNYHRSLPLTARPRMSSRDPLSPPRSADLKRDLFQRSPTWATSPIPKSLTSPRKLKSGTSSKDSSHWLAKFLKKDRAEAQREKDRQKLKSSITVIREQDDYVPAYVVPPGARIRTAYSPDEARSHHF